MRIPVEEARPLVAIDAIACIFPERLEPALVFLLGRVQRQFTKESLLSIELS